MPVLLKDMDAECLGQGRLRIKVAACFQCAKQLDMDEIAIYKRLVDRGARRCLCKECLAQKLGCETAVIERKIEYFKEIGCTLFVR